jgi:hypothetical protein
MKTINKFHKLTGRLRNGDHYEFYDEIACLIGMVFPGHVYVGRIIGRKPSGDKIMNGLLLLIKQILSCKDVNFFVHSL